MCSLLWAFPGQERHNLFLSFHNRPRGVGANAEENLNSQMHIAGYTSNFASKGTSAFNSSVIKYIIANRAYTNEYKWYAEVYWDLDLGPPGSKDSRYQKAKAKQEEIVKKIKATKEDLTTRYAAEKAKIEAAY